jgi:uncharacterized membrane protein
MQKAPRGRGWKGTVDFGDYIIWKAVGLLVLVFVVNFLYAAVTGKTIEEALRDRAAAKGQDRSEGPASE